MSRKNQILQIIPVALAIIFGVAVVFALGADNADFADSADYLAAARMMVTNGTYPESGIIPVLRPPLYPGFIAIIWSIFPGSILAIKIGQVLLNATACWLVFKNAFLITKNQFLAFTAAMFFAVNPFFLYAAGAIQSESLQIFLITFSIFLIVRMALSTRVTLKSAAIVGVSFGIAALCKPSALGVGGFLAVVLFAINRGQTGSLIASAVIVTVMFMVILPWSFYNLKTKGEFILINDAGGYDLWAGNLPESIKVFEGGFASKADASLFEHYLGTTVTRAQISEFENTTGYSALSLKQRESLWLSKAIENAKSDPGVTVKLFAWKFYNLWKPYLSSIVYSTKAVIVSAIFMGSLFVFGLFGILKLRKDERTKNIAILFFAMAFVVTVIHVIILSSLRLRLPYIDTFLTVFAGIGLGSLLLSGLEKLGIANLFGIPLMGMSGSLATE